MVAIALDEPWSVISRLVAYAAHARAAGIEVAFKMLVPEGIEDRLELASFHPAPEARITDLSQLAPRPDDVVLFATPKVHHTVTAQYGRRRPRFIHLVQSGLTALAVGEVGYGYRLFQKPMTRLVVSSRVAEDVARLVGDGIEMQHIEAGFVLDPFDCAPTGNDPFRVVVNAFDGEFTGQVLDVARDRGFSGEVIVVENSTPFEARVAAYQASTALLAAPRFGEGVYQPAWEAMKAGCAVVMTNCEALTTLPRGVEVAEVVSQRDLEGMVRALLRLEAMAPAELARMRTATKAAFDTLPRTDERAAAQAMFAAMMRQMEAAG